MRICCVGDLFLGGDLLDNGQGGVFDPTIFDNCGVIIANLEHPISDCGDLADKCTLFAGTRAIEFLAKFGRIAVNLANNHIHDKGTVGLVDTLSNLESAKVGFFGAGRNLQAASEPFWITDSLAAFGYCCSGSKYLRNVLIATENSPGVNPLTADAIKRDLNKLPEGTKAILFFHWGQEHVWLPPKTDLYFMHQILSDERVCLVIGSHAHRPQGYVSCRGKRGYMCLGNFLFPNFVIKPPVQLDPSAEGKEGMLVTRHYHRVFERTYKKWLLRNRISLVAYYDTDKHNSSYGYAIQLGNSPYVRRVESCWRYFFSSWILILCFLYRLPGPIYSLLRKLDQAFSATERTCALLFFYARQIGINRLSKLIISSLKSRVFT